MAKKSSSTNQIKTYQIIIFILVLALLATFSFMYKKDMKIKKMQQASEASASNRAMDESNRTPYSANGIRFSYSDLWALDSNDTTEMFKEGQIAKLTAKNDQYSPVVVYISNPVDTTKTALDYAKGDYGTTDVSGKEYTYSEVQIGNTTYVTRDSECGQSGCYKYYFTASNNNVYTILVYSINAPERQNENETALEQDAQKVLESFSISE